jgi:Zn-dependent protease
VLNLSLPELLKVLSAVLVGLTVHELAHAWVALRLGDDTARLQGRVTFNPLKHIDPVGMIMLVVAGFGWAKPVMIDRTKLRKPARDDVLIALAGPASNMLLAVVLVLGLWIVVRLVDFPAGGSFATVSSIFLSHISINVALALFNLLPIPPLDGSHVITSLVLRRDPAGAARYFRYGSYALLAVIVLQWITRVDILPIGRVVNAVVTVLLRVVALVN